MFVRTVMALHLVLGRDPYSELTELDDQREENYVAYSNARMSRTLSTR